MTNILTVPMQENDANAATVGEYLAALLTELWREDEGFSGKRPFGNSGWKWEVYFALVREGVVYGVIDSDDELDEVNEDAADALILDAIKTLAVAR